MAVSSSQVSGGTSATLIFSDAGGMAGFQVTLKNKGAAAVFLGPSGVTTGNGYELAANDVLTRECAPGEEIFGIAASGSQAVHVLVTKN